MSPEDSDWGRVSRGRPQGHGLPSITSLVADRRIRWASRSIENTHRSWSAVRVATPHNEPFRSTLSKLHVCVDGSSIDTAHSGALIRITTRSSLLTVAVWLDVLLPCQISYVLLVMLIFDVWGTIRRWDIARESENSRKKRCGVDTTHVDSTYYCTQHTLFLTLHP